MASKKRRRRASEEDGPRKNAGAKQATFLDGYHLLPAELQLFILELACFAPSFSSFNTSSSRRTPFQTDVATARNLCLVSRQFSQQADRLLYKDVTITRPTALYALQQALLTKPERGKLIERLHIGPQDILPPQWWPLSQTYIHGCHLPVENAAGGWLKSIRTSLTRESLPFGCDDRQLWSLDRAPRGCREEAVSKAIRRAEVVLGVDLKADRGRDAVPVEAILETQAALDLYLDAIRVKEEENPHLQRLGRRDTRVPARCLNGDCNHYPNLVLETTSTPDSSQDGGGSEAGGAVVLSRGQLLRHIARSGSVTDRFDHPIIFYRSGFKIRVPPPSSEDYADLRYEMAGAPYKISSTSWEQIESLHEAHDWPKAALLQQEDGLYTSSTGHKSLNDAVINTASFASNLRLAKAVLAFTPSLKGLSLTGFCEGAVGGADPRLPSVQRLSLGPAPVCWDSCGYYEGLEAVQDLRIAGAPLTDEDILDIVPAMPRLKRLYWSFKEASDAPSMALTIQAFLKEPEAREPDSSSTKSSPDRLADHFPKVSGDAPLDRQTSLPALPTEVKSKRKASDAPLLVASLDPADVAVILASAPSEDVRKAWLEGRPTTTSAARLLLRENGLTEIKNIAAAGRSTLPSRDSTSRVWAEYYEEGRQWWRGGGAE